MTLNCRTASWLQAPMLPASLLEPRRSEANRCSRLARTENTDWNATLATLVDLAPSGEPFENFEATANAAHRFEKPIIDVENRVSAKHASDSDASEAPECCGHQSELMPAPEEDATDPARGRRRMRIPRLRPQGRRQGMPARAPEGSTDGSGQARRAAVAAGRGRPSGFGVLRRHAVLSQLHLETEASDANTLGRGSKIRGLQQRHILSTQRRETDIRVDVHSCSPVSAEAWYLQSPQSSRMDNLLIAHS
jgi:hypothetical protein